MDEMTTDFGTIATVVLWLLGAMALALCAFSLWLGLRRMRLNGARRALALFRHATGGAMPLVAVGGIDGGAEAYARIRAGASLVQLYTALVYEGPGLPWRMLRELDALLARDGFASVAEAVGMTAATAAP